VAVIRTAFPIETSPARVWAVLSDFAAWPDWNPSVPRISGECRIGATLHLTLAMPRRPSANVTAVVTVAEPDRSLHWHGNVVSDRIFSGTREFDIEPQPDGSVVVTHVEDVRGLLFPVFKLVMGDAIQKHHDNLNRALTERAERVDA
jgi:hypothetical protein